MAIKIQIKCYSTAKGPNNLTNAVWIMNSDVQIFQIYGHTTRFPDFRVIGTYEIQLESDMAD